MLDSSSVYTVSDKFSYIVYKAFLKYLYTGKIHLSTEKALGKLKLNVNWNYRNLTTQKLKRHFVTELMELAKEYGETNLIENCSQIIKQDITVSNVTFFYNKAIEYSAKVNITIWD